MRRALALLLALAPLAAAAEGLKTHPVAPGIWAIEGPSEQRSPANLGNNATFGLIETAEGAVLVDPGGSWKGAAQLHAAVKALTTQPVALVINTGGQDHRWLGNGYWAAQGARIIAPAAAVEDQMARGSLQLSMLSQLIGAGLDGTEPLHAGETFGAGMDLSMGGVRMELRNPAPAHTPGDSFVWLPEAGVVFTGDIVFVGRLLGILEFSDSAGWLEAFDAVAALKPAHVVPGHGAPTDMATATAQTRAYIADLRAKMAAHIDGGGDIMGAAQVDQSAFAELPQFEQLAGRNAQAVFQAMEWE